MSKLYSDEEIEAIKEEAYKDGANSAVMWLEEVYGDGIHGTDAWAAYGGEAEGCECEWCSAEEDEEEE